MRRPRGRAAIRRRCGWSAAGWCGRASRSSGRTGRRLLLSGDIAQIREDAEGLAGQGVTELFYDLNWDPQIGSPDADPVAATARATELLEALAPAS